MTARDDRKTRVGVWVFLLIVVVIAIGFAVFAYQRPSTDNTPVIGAQATATGQATNTG